MEHAAAVLEGSRKGRRKSDAFGHIKVQQASVSSPCSGFSSPCCCWHNSHCKLHPLGARGSVWDRPWCQAGGRWAPPLAFQGQEMLQGPPGHLGKQGSSGRSQALGFGIPCVQPSLVWFYLSCEGCGVESAWKQLNSH